MGKVMRKKRVMKHIDIPYSSRPTSKSEIRLKINEFMLRHREFFDGKRLLDFGSGKTKQYRGFFQGCDHVPIDKVFGTDICKKMEVRGDCGVCIAVLEHCMDPVSALKNIRECIGTGHLLIAVSIKYVLHMLPDDYYRFTQEFWRVVEMCEFEIIDKDIIRGKGLDGEYSEMLTIFCRGRQDA